MALPSGVADGHTAKRRDKLRQPELVVHWSKASLLYFLFYSARRRSDLTVFKQKREGRLAEEEK